MLKWVVTRAPQTVCNEWQTQQDHHWRWTVDTQSPDQKPEYENNNNISSMETKNCCNDPSSPFLQIAHTPTTVVSNASFKSTASSFRYFLVNNHSSPLEMLRHPIGDCVSRSFSPRRGTGYRRTTAHRRQQRRRFSSLHIREPSELASPSYRQADDPANDLSNDVLLTPLADRVTTLNIPPTQWQEVWDIFAQENEHYNEREIKTPEAERITSLSNDSRQLVRRRAVRRRKTPQASTKHV